MSIPGYPHTAAERFMRYVRIDTQSDAASPTQPSTAKQKDLSRVLVEELLAIGVTDAELDEHGYVYATLPATSRKPVPVLCFCSHVDTAPTSSGVSFAAIWPIQSGEWALRCPLCHAPSWALR